MRKSSAARSGSTPGFSWIAPRLTMLRPRCGNSRAKFAVARQHDPEAHETCAQHILPADRHLAVADLDDPAGVERPEHRAGCAVDEHRVGPFEHAGLPVDAVGNEDVARGIEADHKNIRPHAPFAALPFGKAEIDRRRLLRHPGELRTGSSWPSGKAPG